MLWTLIIWAYRISIPTIYKRSRQSGGREGGRIWDIYPNILGYSSETHLKLKSHKVSFIHDICFRNPIVLPIVLRLGNCNVSYGQTIPSEFAFKMCFGRTSHTHNDHVSDKTTYHEIWFELFQLLLQAINFSQIFFTYCTLGLTYSSQPLQFLLSLDRNNKLRHMCWISNCTHYNVWDEITYPFPNFNGAMWLKLSHVSKRGQWASWNNSTVQ